MRLAADIRSDPATRLAMRQERFAPILARIDDWIAHHRGRAFAKSPLGEALAGIIEYRDGLGRFLIGGCVEIDTETIERTIASHIGTCKMNGVDPHGWQSATLTAIVQGHR